MSSESIYVIEVLSYEPSTGKSLLLGKKSRSKDEMVRVSGFFLGANELKNQTIKVEGKWDKDFIKATRIIKGEDLKLLPFLKDVFDGKSIRGLTPEIAKALETKLGANWPGQIKLAGDKIFDNLPLADHHKKLAKNGWNRFKPFSEDYAVLRNQGLTHQQAFNSITSYGRLASEAINSNPYRLNGVRGVGFKTLDTIAVNKGLPHDSERRLKSLMDEAAARIEGQGSTVLNIRRMAAAISHNGKVPFPTADQFVRTKHSLEYKTVDIPSEGPGIIRKKHLEVSKSIAKEVARLSQGGVRTSITSDDIPSKFPLKEAQVSAVNTTLKSKFSVITGRPGTGKSTIADQVMKGVKMESPNCKIATCAFSGKAARRLSETTGEPAKTIHSLLKVKQGQGFEHNSGNKLDIDVLIVDEASMIDEGLFLDLLSAVPNHARIVIMGDYEQIPSINPGQVLKDFIDSECIAVSVLKDIMRVKPGSSLIPNAHRIADGKMPNLNTDPGDDFQWIDAENDEEILAKIQEIIQSKIENGISPDSIQMLTPQMYKGPGTTTLNKMSNDIFNTDKRRHVLLNHMGETYRIGDRVMQIKKNDYELGLNNGDMGKIDDIDFSNKTVRVKLSDKSVDVPFKKVSNLTNANAITFHKSQGSEYEDVIIPLSESHKNMLNIELIYTAITRAKTRVHVVGNRNTLKQALDPSRNRKRSTILKPILQSVLRRSPKVDMELSQSS